MFPYTATVGFLDIKKCEFMRRSWERAERVCQLQPSLLRSWSVLQCSCSQFVWRAHWYNPIAT